MPQEQILAELGPFTGFNTKTANRLLDDGKSPDTSGWDANIISGAFVPAAGRTSLFGPGASGAVLPFLGVVRFYLAGSSNYIVAAGPNGFATSGESLYSWNGATLSNIAFPAAYKSPLGSNLVRFIQFQNWLFMTNSGQGLSNPKPPPVKMDSSNAITAWQYAAPVTGGAPLVGWGGQVTVGGTYASGKALTVTINGTPVNYTTTVGDANLTGVATSMTAAINAAAISGVTATSVGTVISIASLTTASITLTASGTAPVTMTASIASGLVGTYYYRYTYSNALQETGPSIIGQLAGTTTQGVTYNATTTGFGAVQLIGTTDTNITTINLYRLGGTSGQWTQVQSVANPGNTTPFSVVDNVSDLNLTGQALVLHRDVPANFTDIALHKDRIWGFGTGTQPADLWYSNYAEPWGFDNTNQVIPIGREQAGDIGVALMPLGSILLCFKSFTTWAVFGDSQADFISRLMFTTGCGAQFSVVAAEGVVYWINGAGKIYSFDGASLQYISEEIQPTLNAISSSNRSGAIGFYSNNTYYLSIPGSAITFCYDTLHKEWSQLAWAAAAVWNNTDTGEVVGGRVGSFNGDTWFADVAGSDLGSNTTAYYVSKIFKDPENTTKTLRYLEIYCPRQSSSQQITVTVTAEPDAASPRSTSIVLNLNAGTQKVSLPANLVCKEFNIKVQFTGANANATPEIDRIAVIGWAKRATRITED